MEGSQLSELQDDSEQLRPHVERLRGEVLRAVGGTGGASADFSNAFLLKFLRARDFNVDLSLKLLLNYIRWREESPEISTCLSPTSVLGLLTTSYHAVLPHRDQTGSRVLIYRIGQWNPKDWSAFQVFRVSLMTSEIICMEIETQRRGVKVIFDLHGWCLGHALQINPSLARKISSVLSDSFPLKVRGIHLVNEPMFFRPVFAMIRRLLPEKIKNRIHLHGSGFQCTLSNFFPPHVLPPEYGGQGLAIEEACQDWTNQLLQSELLLEQIAAHPTGDVATSRRDTGTSEDAVIMSKDDVITSDDVIATSEKSIVSEDAIVSKDTIIPTANTVSDVVTVSKEASVSEEAAVCKAAADFEDTVVSKEADILEDANVLEDPTVFYDTTVSEEANVSGETVFCKDAAVREDATVCNEATVSEEGTVSGEAVFSKHAPVYEDAIVCGEAAVSEEATVCKDSTTCKQAAVSEQGIVREVTTTSSDSEDATVFHGTTVCKDADVSKNDTLCEETSVPRNPTVFKDANISGGTTVYEDSNISKKPTDFQEATVSNHAAVSEDAIASENIFVCDPAS